MIYNCLILKTMRAKTSHLQEEKRTSKAWQPLTKPSSPVLILNVAMKTTDKGDILKEQNPLKGVARFSATQGRAVLCWLKHFIFLSTNRVIRCM